MRLAELVATLSLTADLGLGQPMEHCMRQTVIALRLGDRIGLQEPDRAATYYLGLLRHVYCHADATEQAKWFGDDIQMKANGFALMDSNPVMMMPRFLKTVGAGDSGLARAKKLAAFPGSGLKQLMSFADTHSALASQFAERIGLDEVVSKALRQGYEQWDGKGVPNRLAGESIGPAPRLVGLAAVVEIFGRNGGVEAAVRVARRHRGGMFDPALVDTFAANAEELLAELGEASSWNAVIGAEPGLGRVVAGSELDGVLEAMADLVDMKSPQFAGHSRGVANLASQAARTSGLPDDEVATIYRAGLIQDLGRLGVSNGIWDKPGTLTETEMERVRLHPYLTDRMLAGVPALSRSRELAARHHERLDGSGYPRGLNAQSLTPGDRILAAADAYHAMTEPRAYRPALEPEQASEELRAEARAGRLDGDAVNAVLKAAGHRAPARREWPARLTAREVEVLGLLARGHPNKTIAQKLTVTPKTVSNHVEHIYRKIDVSSRAAATLFATQNGLVGSFEPS